MSTLKSTACRILSWVEIVPNKHLKNCVVLDTISPRWHKFLTVYKIVELLLDLEYDTQLILTSIVLSKILSRVVLCRGLWKPLDKIPSPYLPTRNISWRKSHVLLLWCAWAPFYCKWHIYSWYSVSSQLTSSGVK